MEPEPPEAAPEEAGSEASVLDPVLVPTSSPAPSASGSPEPQAARVRDATRAAGRSVRRRMVEVMEVSPSVSRGVAPRVRSSRPQVAACPV